MQVMAEDAGARVLSESTRLHLEKLAEEFAKEAMADPEFREEMRQSVKQAIKDAFAQMKQ